MNKAIWKFELEVTDNQVIEIPIDSEILTAQVQNGKPCLWALVNPTKNKEKRFIEMFGTGHEIDMNVNRNYLGTIQLHDGLFIVHVFEYANT